MWQCNFDPKNCARNFRQFWWIICFLYLYLKYEITKVFYKIYVQEGFSNLSPMNGNWRKLQVKVMFEQRKKKILQEVGWLLNVQAHKLFLSIQQGIENESIGIYFRICKSEKQRDDKRVVEEVCDYQRGTKDLLCRLNFK